MRKNNILIFYWGFICFKVILYILFYLNLFFYMFFYCFYVILIELFIFGFCDMFKVGFWEKG